MRWMVLMLSCLGLVLAAPVGCFGLFDDDGGGGGGDDDDENDDNGNDDGVSEDFRDLWEAWCSKLRTCNEDAFYAQFDTINECVDAMEEWHDLYDSDECREWDIDVTECESQLSCSEWSENAQSGCDEAFPCSEIICPLLYEC